MSNKLKQFKKKIKFDGETPTVTMPDMYTLNRQLMAKEPILSPSGIEAVKQSLYLVGYIVPDNDYALLCRERYDFTAFRCKKSVQLCIQELIEILMLRGDIISIDRQDDGTYECWVKDGDDDAVMYKFFKCDWIIDC